jgi:hypothetical protein
VDRGQPVTRLTIFATLFGVLAFSPGVAMSKNERAILEDQIRSLDKDQVHKMVEAVEAEPVGGMADAMRPALIIYFEPIHYDVYLDQIGFLMEAEPKLLMHVFWQVVFSSGDFFLQHPEQSTDRLVYMQAGLEGALRVYERILALKPKAKNAKLDELVALRNAGHLADYVRSNPCDKK